MALIDDQLKALKFESPQYIPVRVSLLPATWMKYGDRLGELVEKHPSLFPDKGKKCGVYDEVTGKYVEGEAVDEWGCVWNNVEEGMCGLVTGHPIARREDIRSLQPPTEVIDSHPHGFMFLRIFDLRGFEEAMIDFAEEPPELQTLIDMVCDYNMKCLEKRLPLHEGPIINFGDDNGMQNALPISPAKWRKYFKPAYAKIFGRCRREGLFVYMHTDGCIHEIIGDFIECGVNVINPQIRANGLDNLVRVAKGKVCIDLDLDRQMFPFCRPEEIDPHVRECIEALGSPEGGLWLLAECAPDVPLDTIDAICNALEKYRGYFS